MPTDYTSRDFASIKTDLLRRASSQIPEWTTQASPDFANMLVDLWAYMGDVQNYYIDRAYRESYINTATLRSTVLSLAKMMGYTANVMTSSRATVSVSNSSSASITLPKGTVFQVPSTNTTTPIYFISQSAISVPTTGASVPVIEGQEFTETLTPNFDGTSARAFQLSEQGVVPSSLTATVGTDTYTYTSDITTVSAGTPAFTSVVDSDNYTRVVFGNGVNGRIPPTGSTITCTYRVGQGTTGNVAANKITVMTSPVQGIAITSSTEASGGSDAESIASIRNNAPTVRRTQDRAVTLADYRVLMENYGGVSKAIAIQAVSSGAVTIHYSALPEYSNFENIATTIDTLYLSPNTEILTGTAQAGAATTITLAASGPSATDDFYNDMLIEITGGTGSGQTAVISDYVGSTKVATVPTWTTNPDNTSTYKITANTKTNFGSAGLDIENSLADYLTARKMVGVSINQISSTINLTGVYVDFNSVVVKDGYYQTNVKSAIDQAVRKLFTWQQVGFNKTFRLSDVLTAAASVDGVSSLTIGNLGTSGGSNVGDYTPSSQTTSSAINIPVLRTIGFTGVTGGIA